MMLALLAKESVVSSNAEKQRTEETPFWDTFYSFSGPINKKL